MSAQRFADGGAARRRAPRQRGAARRERLPGGLRGGGRAAARSGSRTTRRAQRLLRLHLLGKALYEIDYEAEQPAGLDRNAGAGRSVDPGRAGADAHDGAKSGSAAASDRRADGRAPTGASRRSRRRRPPPIAAIVAAEHGDPFAVLGPHEVAPGPWEIRAMLPEARASRSCRRGRRRRARRWSSVTRPGFFVARLDGAARPDLPPARSRPAAAPVLRDDPYRFGAGPRRRRISARIRDVGGDAAVSHARRAAARRSTGVDGLRASRSGRRTRGGSASSATSTTGTAAATRCACATTAASGSCSSPASTPGARYKYEIKGADGELLPLKADPVAFAAEQPPATASVAARRCREFAWRDDAWMARRGAGDPRKAPISVYECHLGSWARVPEEGNRYLTYRELAERLIPYVKDMGFTHIELLPITEYPVRRLLGLPAGLAVRADEPLRHARRISPPSSRPRTRPASASSSTGCPGHFPNDAHGLGHFDGTHLYEHADPRQGFHQDWGTYIYNYGRQEVAAFLVANARFWLERYHLDGLRVDAVASMLYLDYSRKAGEWVPNRYGGNENLEAIDFLRRMNEAAYAAAPGVMTDRRGIDRLARRLAPDLHRRPRLRLQVEHGLDARHAALHRRRTRSTAATTTTT